jgi:hypothetical protein
VFPSNSSLAVYKEGGMAYSVTTVSSFGGNTEGKQQVRQLAPVVVPQPRRLDSSDHTTWRGPRASRLPLGSGKTACPRRRFPTEQAATTAPARPHPPARPNRPQAAWRKERSMFDYYLALRTPEQSDLLAWSALPHAPVLSDQPHRRPTGRPAGAGRAHRRPPPSSRPAGLAANAILASADHRGCLAGQGEECGTGDPSLRSDAPRTDALKVQGQLSRRRPLLGPL